MRSITTLSTIKLHTMNLKLSIRFSPQCYYMCRIFKLFRYCHYAECHYDKCFGAITMHHAGTECKYKQILSIEWHLISPRQELVYKLSQTGDQCYKTFYSRKLWVFTISQCVVPSESFQGSSSKFASLLCKLYHCFDVDIIFLYCEKI